MSIKVLNIDSTGKSENLNLSEKLIKNEVVIKLFSALCVGIGVFGIAYF